MYWFAGLLFIKKKEDIIAVSNLYLFNVVLVV